MFERSGMRKKLDILGLVFFTTILAFSIGLQVAQPWTGTPNTLSDGYMEVNNFNVTSEFYLNSVNITDRLGGTWDVNITAPWLNATSGLRGIGDIELESAIGTSYLQMDSCDILITTLTTGGTTYFCGQNGTNGVLETYYTGVTGFQDIFKWVVDSLNQTGGHVIIKEIDDYLAYPGLGIPILEINVSGLPSDITIEGWGIHQSTTIRIRGTDDPDYGVTFDAGDEPGGQYVRSPHLIFKNIEFIVNQCFGGWLFTDIFAEYRNCRMVSRNADSGNGNAWRLIGAGPRAQLNAWSDITIVCEQTGSVEEKPWMFFLHVEGISINKVWAYTSGDNIGIFRLTHLFIQDLVWLVWGENTDNNTLFLIEASRFPRRVYVNVLSVSINEPSCRNISVLQAFDDRASCRIDYLLYNMDKAGFSVPFNKASAQYVSVGYSAPHGSRADGYNQTVYPSNFYEIEYSHDSAWSSDNNGTGARTGDTFYTYIKTGATNDSVATSYGEVYGLALEGQSRFQIDFSKEFWFEVVLYRHYSDVGSIARVQLKQATAFGSLAAAGLGIEIRDLTVYLETYGTALATVNSGFTMVGVKEYHFQIRHIPGLNRTELYVDGTLLALQTNSTYIPRSITGATTNLVISAKNVDSDVHLAFGNFAFKVRHR